MRRNKKGCNDVTSRFLELRNEIKAVKEKEEELMLEALGMKKSTKRQTTDFGKKLQKWARCRF